VVPRESPEGITHPLLRCFFRRQLSHRYYEPDAVLRALFPDDVSMAEDLGITDPDRDPSSVEREATRIRNDLHNLDS
jgi:hypothetical protein